MVIPTVGTTRLNPVLLHPITPTTTTRRWATLFEVPLRPMAGHPILPRVLVQPTRKEAAPLLHMAGFTALTAALIPTPSGNRVTPRLTYCKMSTL